MREFDDILRLPHPQSKTRRHMSVSDRAAQFASFAALTGHSAAIRETARLTDKKTELSEDDAEELNRILQELSLLNRPEIQVLYFVPDRKKSGGAYVTARGILKRIDPTLGRLELEDGNAIALADIRRIQKAEGERTV